VTTDNLNKPTNYDLYADIITDATTWAEFGATEAAASITIFVFDAAPCSNSASLTHDFYIDTMAPTFTIIAEATNAVVNPSESGVVAVGVSEKLDEVNSVINATLTYVTGSGGVREVFWNEADYSVYNSINCIVLDTVDTVSGIWNDPDPDKAATLTVKGTLKDVNGNETDLIATPAVLSVATTTINDF
jgi:hypothetical protein